MIAEGPPARGTLWGWSLLAVSSLALAGLFAILLVLSRTPIAEDLIDWPVEFFKKGLVAHVILSFAVWFLAIMGCLGRLLSVGREKAVPGDRWMSRWGLGLASAGTIALLLPALMDRGEPTLNNYIPIIIDPLYYTGLVLLALGVLLVVPPMLMAIAGRPAPRQPAHSSLATAGLLYVIALIGFAVALGGLAGRQPSHDFNESLVWGGGHLLQFVNLALLFAAWSLLGDKSLGTPLAPPRLIAPANLILLLAGFAGLGFFALFPVGGATHGPAFTNLQYAMLPAAALVLWGAGGVFWRHRRTLPWRDPVFLCLTTSMALFMVGGMLGFFVDGTDTRTPAHYHGVIGGMNLAFVGLFYGLFLPALGRPVRPGRFVRAQIYFYAAGQFLFVFGMFMAGGMGAARKIMGAGISMDNAAAVAAAVIRDVGGALSIVGGVMFIIIALGGLMRRP